ncbi:MAG TPA: hypothetical protein VF721_21485 [Pyrinomonadaceae bacterium]|jgi:hypothetical protein
MKFKYFITLLIIFAIIFPFSESVQGAAGDLPVPPLFYRQKISEGDYLGALLEFKKREAEYRASPFKSLFLQVMAPLESQVGNYNEAYAYFDEFRSSFWKPQPDIASSPLDNDSPQNALKTIGSIAARRQVIMINEEHDTPMHRAFTARLLPILYKKGFRYFAPETIVDEQINERGYAIQKSGFYHSDPVYGDLIRTAIKLGFKIVSYDLSPDCKNPPDNSDYCQDVRERSQAQNLSDRILKNDPKAKILVHVGRTHNQKTKLETWALMGWHFKQITGIDPLTIDQTQMSERSRPDYESATFRYAVKKWNFTAPTIFQSKDGKYSSNPSYDLTIFHPRSIYKDARPTWLEMGGARKSLALYGEVKNGLAQPFLPPTGGTFLVQAFAANESNEAIPIDQIIVTDAKKAPVLMLPAKGDFRLRAIDASGKTVVETKVSIK